MKNFETKSFVEKFAKEKKEWDPNPFAVCSKNIDKKDDPEKWESCVLQVKKKQKKSSVDNEIKKAYKQGQIFTSLYFEDDTEIPVRVTYTHLSEQRQTYYDPGFPEDIEIDTIIRSDTQEPIDVDSLSDSQKEILEQEIWEDIDTWEDRRHDLRKDFSNKNTQKQAASPEVEQEIDELAE